MDGWTMNKRTDQPTVCNLPYILIVPLIHPYTHNIVSTHFFLVNPLCQTQQFNQNHIALHSFLLVVVVVARATSQHTQHTVCFLFSPLFLPPNRIPLNVILFLLHEFDRLQSNQGWAVLAAHRFSPPSQTHSQHLARGNVRREGWGTKHLQLWRIFTFCLFVCRHRNDELSDVVLEKCRIFVLPGPKAKFTNEEVRQCHFSYLSVHYIEHFSFDPSVIGIAKIPPFQWFGVGVRHRRRRGQERHKRELLAGRIWHFTEFRFFCIWFHLNARNFRLKYSDTVIRTVFHKYFDPKEALVSNGVLNRAIPAVAGVQRSSAQRANRHHHHQHIGFTGGQANFAAGIGNNPQRRSAALALLPDDENDGEEAENEDNRWVTKNESISMQSMSASVICAISCWTSLIIWIAHSLFNVFSLPSFFHSSALAFVYPYGCTLNVSSRVSVCALSTGTVCYPISRPVCAFHQIQKVKNK